MKTSTHLRKARALVNKGWCKGRFSMVNKEGVQCYCAHGALGTIAAANGNKAWQYVYNSIVTYRPSFDELGIIVFNDHPSTTKKDVLAVFDLAIKKAVEDERSSNADRNK